MSWNINITGEPNAVMVELDDAVQEINKTILALNELAENGSERVAVHVSGHIYSGTLSMTRASQYDIAVLKPDDTL